MIALSLFASLAFADAPEIEPCFAMKPTYTVDGNKYGAGTMFAVTAGERTLLVTAHHLFGPAGGMPANLTGPQIGEKVTQVVARDAYAMRTLCGSSETPVVVADAAPMAQGNMSKDLAVFAPKQDTSINRLATLDKPTFAPHALATSAPSVGDTVYVVASISGKDDRVHAAEVVELASQGMYYKFSDATLELQASNGAPIVNGEGAIVGMHLGGGRMEDGALIGAGTPHAVLKSRLEALASQ